MHSRALKYKYANNNPLGAISPGLARRVVIEIIQSSAPTIHLIKGRRLSSLLLQSPSHALKKDFQHLAWLLEQQAT